MCSSDLATLRQAFPVDTPGERRRAVHAFARHTNFFLAAQAANDTDLLRAYGRLLADVMGAAYPEWVQPLPPPALDAGARIRVGVVSGCVWRHSVYKTHGAWLRELDRSRFDVYGYYTGAVTDDATDPATGTAATCASTTDPTVSRSAGDGHQRPILMSWDCRRTSRTAFAAATTLAVSTGTAGNLSRLPDSCTVCVGRIPGG